MPCVPLPRRKNGEPPLDAAVLKDVQAALNSITPEAVQRYTLGKGQAAWRSPSRTLDNM
jgi:hypothetical protein